MTNTASGSTQMVEVQFFNDRSREETTERVTPELAAL